MNRNEEYNALLRELEQVPPALDGTVDRARARLRRRRAGRWWGIPAASLAGVAAAFVLLVNYSMPFAQACSAVPVLRELMAAVAFSPSLKLAVEHNYAQYIGEEQTQNGVTLRLEYLILDQGQLQFFLKASGPWDSYQAHPTLTDGDGVPVEGNVVSSTLFDRDELVGAASVHVLSDSFRFPDVLRITFHLTGESHSGQAPANARDDEEQETTPAYEGDFVFEVPLDASHLNEVISIPMGDWVEVDGQLLRFALDSYPTHGRLTVEEHPDNTTSLAGLDFYLEDDRGNRYEDNPSGSIGGLGNSRMCDTTFFSNPAHLTLHITRLDWLEPEKEWVTVDLERGVALDPLPEGVKLAVNRTENSVIELAFLAPSSPSVNEGATAQFRMDSAMLSLESTSELVFYQVGSGNYRSPDGEEHDFGGHSVMHTERLWYGTDAELTVPEGCFVELYRLVGYEEDTVDIGLHFTRRNAPDTPISVTLK